MIGMEGERGARVTRATEVMGQKEEKKEKEEEEKEKKEEEKKANWRGTGKSKALQEVLADLKTRKKSAIASLSVEHGMPDNFLRPV